MRGKVSFRVPPIFLTISAALFLTILWTQSLSAQTPPAPFGPEWLAGMIDEGWRKVHDGVLERQAEGSVETFTYGEEGRRNRVRRLRERINALRIEHSAHPSADLTRILSALQSQLAQAEANPSGNSSGSLSESSSQSSLGSLSESSVSAELASGCEPALGGQASAGPLTGAGAPGTSASANASYSSCGELGHTYAYAYARAASGSTTNIRAQEDPKNDGSALSSTAGASASGTVDCYSEAYAQAWSSVAPGGPSYEVQAANFSCSGAASVTIGSPSPGATVGSPFRVTVTENTAAPAALTVLILDGQAITRDYGVDTIEWSIAASPGPHTLGAKVWYADGTSPSVAQVSFTVSNPAVTVTTPVAGATYNSPIWVIGFENTSRPPATMQYWLDGVGGPAIQPTDSYRKLIDVEPGNHQLVMRASYPDGTYESTTVDFKVRPGKVTIASPSDGATVSSPIRVVANEGSTLNAVLMGVHLDGWQVYSVHNSDTVDTYINATPGVHTISVHAYYSDGTGAERTIRVTVP